MNEILVLDITVGVLTFFVVWLLLDMRMANGKIRSLQEKCEYLDSIVTMNCVWVDEDGCRYYSLLSKRSKQEREEKA